MVTEVAYLLGARLGWDAEARFLGDLANGAFTLEPVHPADALRMVELVAQYHDLPLGSVDASIVAAAERLDVTEIATVDRRHFSVVRPRHTSAFELRPRSRGTAPPWDAPTTTKGGLDDRPSPTRSRQAL